MPKGSRSPRGPGRPRADTSSNPYENKRRQQLRNAQQSYRRRKDAEIAELKIQMKKMQTNAAKLSKSLLGLLDNVIQDSTSLNPIICNYIATSVKHMLPIADAISHVETGEQTVALPPESADKGSTVEKDSQYLELDTLYLLKTPRASFIQESLFPVGSQLDTSNLASVNESPKSNVPYLFRDWFTASYLAPGNPIDPFNTFIYPGASLAIRITHTALKAASYILRNPKTSANVGPRMFPFHTGPLIRSELASKVDQLLFITDQLLVSSRYSMRDSQASGNDSEPSVVRKYFEGKSYYESQEWRRKYGQWLSAYDVEMYLQTNFGVTESVDYIYIKYQDNTRQGIATNLVGVDIDVPVVSIKKSDLINDIVKYAVCVEDVPSFQFTDVRDVLERLIYKAMQSDQIVDEVQ
ncbi:hypothetical protein B7463_g4913, partial [Scytalidium lignicola]